MLTFYSWRFVFTCYKSKGEKQCKMALKNIFKNHDFITIRPNWLKNPETGKNLEIDLYNDNLKLGIEYNGYQHYIFPNRYHKSRRDFIAQVRRDMFKQQVCDKMGIYIIVVPFHISNNNIENYIRQKLHRIGYLTRK